MFRLHLSLCTVLLLTIGAWLIAMRPCYAYIDPGIGSYVFQIAIASLVGLALAIKSFWRQISLFIGRLFARKDDRLP